MVDNPDQNSKQRHGQRCSYIRIQFPMSFPVAVAQPFFFARQLARQRVRLFGSLLFFVAFGHKLLPFADNTGLICGVGEQSQLASALDLAHDPALHLGADTRFAAGEDASTPVQET